MALLWMEGFDTYNAFTDITRHERYYEEIAGSDPVFITGSSGSGQALEADSKANDIGFTFSQASTSTFYGGFSIKIDEYNPAERYVFRFFEEANANESFYIVMHSGKVHIHRGTTTLVSTALMAVNKWHYVAFKIFLDNTTGTVDIYLDGILSESASSIDTIDAGGGATIQHVYIEFPSGIYMAIDDVYFGDDSGSDLTDVVTVASIETLLPDGAGSSTQFSPDGAASPSGDNYQNVNGSTKDDDTTYNTSSTATHKDMFTMGSMSASSGTVYAVQVKGAYAKQDAGYREVRNVLLSNATTSNGATKGVIYSDYQTNADIFENDPDGGGNWTVSAVNAIEAGYEIVS